MVKYSSPLLDLSVPSLSNGANFTASGRTSLTSCANTPTNLSSVLNLATSFANSFQLYVNPLSFKTFSNGFSINSILVFNLLSDEYAITSLPASILPSVADGLTFTPKAPAVTFTSPFASNLYPGLVVPKPTKPVPRMLRTSSTECRPIDILLLVEFAPLYWK